MAALVKYRMTWGVALHCLFSPTVSTKRMTLYGGGYSYDETTASRVREDFPSLASIKNGFRRRSHLRYFLSLTRRPW
uniref:Putative secreted protein n=1 Tax=Ixodes ricinus TaxID=34613 RepID=A0A6B0TUH2_IXORI